MWCVRSKVGIVELWVSKDELSLIHWVFSLILFSPLPSHQQSTGVQSRTPVLVTVSGTQQVFNKCLLLLFSINEVCKENFTVRSCSMEAEGQRKRCDACMKILII